MRHGRKFEGGMPGLQCISVNEKNIIINKGFLCGLRILHLTGEGKWMEAFRLSYQNQSMCRHCLSVAAWIAFSRKTRWQIQTMTAAGIKES